MSSKKINLKGKRFGRLLVVKGTDKTRHHSCLWECVCDCGTKKLLTVNNLLRGGRNYTGTKSCGCLAMEIITNHKWNITHGLSKHPMYFVWQALKQRCFNKKDKGYHNYGGRGITVSKEWMKFETFYKDMISKYKRGLEIDRIDNNGNYCKENCHWVTCKENNNNRRDNIINKLTEK